MTIHYSEKRNFIRMRTDYPIQYKIMGTNKYLSAQCLDLSASGVLISTDYSIKPGTRIDIEIQPKIKIIPPFLATVEVVRSQNIAEGVFQIGASIVDKN